MPPRSPGESVREFLDDCIARRGFGLHPVEDGCEDAVRILFNEVYMRIGGKEAFRIFGMLRPPKGNQRKWLHDEAMLDRYHFRHSRGWGPERIAKEIAEDNAKIVEANKNTPTGTTKARANNSTSVKTIERRLNRVLSARREIAERYALRQQQLKEGILAEVAGNACPWFPGIKPRVA